MHRTIVTLKSGFAYASFPTPEVREATLKLIDELGTDLENAEYDHGSTVESAMSDLEEVLNEQDTSTEDTEAAIEEAVTDPDAVVGEEDENEKG